MKWMKCVVLWLVSMALFAATGGFAAADPGDVRVFDSTSLGKVEPPRVKLAYGANKFVLTKLEPWRRWNSAKASSSVGNSSLNGDATVDGRRTRARLTMSKIDSCFGSPVYTKAVIRPSNFYFEIDGERRRRLALRLSCSGMIRDW